MSSYPNTNNALQKDADFSAIINGFLGGAEIVDLSHHIGNTPPCTLIQTGENIATTETEHGESVGVLFRTTKVNNLYLNYGTHIDFPGHLHEINDCKKIGEYKIEKFIAEAVIVDVSDKVRAISQYFSDDAHLDFDKFGRGDEFVKKLLGILDSLEISLDFFNEKIDGESIRDKSVIFYTELSKHWRNRIFNGWQYAYFINPFISGELADFLVKSKVKNVGVDALQLEHPIINLDGREWGAILSDKYKEKVLSKLRDISKNMIHKKLE